MKYKIAVFPGDGVGPELISEGIKLIEKAAELDRFEIEFVKYNYSADYFDETNGFLSTKTLKEIKDNCNAIYCGTFDYSRMPVDSNVPLLIKEYFGQTIILRPIKLFSGIEGPLNSDDINYTIIRENNEDFYVGLHGRAKNGKTKQQLENKSCKVKFNIEIEAKGNELAYQVGILSKKTCERVMNYAFHYANTNGKKHIVSVDKANVLGYYNIWRECLEKVAKGYADIKFEHELIDNAVMNLIRQPEKYSIIIAPNLFGDILSDLSTVLQGGVGYGVRGNINPDGISMFEPIHGCAIKLKDTGIVNPIATIWAAALMLENLGQKQASDLIIKSIETVLKEGRTRTQDLGGNNSTSDMGDVIKDKFVGLHD